MKVTIKILRLLLGLYLMFYFILLNPFYVINRNIYCPFSFYIMYLLFVIVLSYIVLSCVKAANILFLEKVIVLIVFLLGFMFGGCYSF